jgi:cobalt/nickel transport protein
MSLSRRLALISCVSCVLGGATSAWAHFGLILPSDDIVSQQDAKKVGLAVRFLHPMEGHSMAMAKPKRFGVLHGETTTDLLATLIESTPNKGKQQQEGTTWQAAYQIKRPGDYTFYVEPEPYWEPAEDSFIVHYTKVCVNALGLEEGWDRPVGLETEIIPKTRPYGLWTGNVFTGQVLIKGKPAADITVEIEYLNESQDNPKTVRPPSDPFIAQVVKTDDNGFFTYAMPRAGWWGFAALSTADHTISKDGVDKPVEIGAVYWVHTTNMQ